MADSIWLVRRVIGARGTPLRKPSLWGVVRASSESVAITKFIWASKSADSPSHFDAIPKENR